MAYEYKVASPSATVPNYEPRDEIEEAIFSLVKKGRIVDSGRRRFTPTTGRFAIVWMPTPPHPKVKSIR